MVLSSYQGVGTIISHRPRQVTIVLSVDCKVLVKQVPAALVEAVLAGSFGLRVTETHSKSLSRTRIQVYLTGLEGFQKERGLGPTASFLGPCCCCSLTAHLPVHSPGSRQLCSESHVADSGYQRSQTFSWCNSRLSKRDSDLLRPKIGHCGTQGASHREGWPL